MKELAKLQPSSRAFGLAGPRAESAGMECIVRLEDVSVIGLVEVLGKLPALSAAMRRLCTEAESRRPDVAVLIDFSGFNLRLARRLRALDIPVVYYVSPQVWAWRRGRLRTIRETVDEMLVILPFEKAIYEHEGVRVRYVGHPLVDLVHATEDRSAFCQRVGLDAARPIIAMLPGSRRREVELHLPILAQVIEKLMRQHQHAHLQFVVSRASTIPVELLRDGLGTLFGDRVRLLDGSAYDGLVHAAAAVVASGTATVEAALAGTPMVVVYRTGWASYLLGKRFVKVPFYSMVNLIAERELVAELMQDAMTPDNIIEHLMPLLAQAGDIVRDGLVDVRNRLGGGGASKRAADAVVSHFKLS